MRLSLIIHYDGAGYAVGTQILYGLLHGIHGGGHECAQSHCIGLFIYSCLKYGLLGDILTQICHAESVTLHHNLDYVLAYVMDIALDGGNYHVTL